MAAAAGAVSRSTSGISRRAAPSTAARHLAVRSAMPAVLKTKGRVTLIDGLLAPPSCSACC
ncbi:hypothetical protein AB0L75_27885 [Streptomyces sp. NPDC052101]|uniref:hypothetical protein n=1 Tax=Streptomyces sp. NPDC052101 TaxID=3155763 RepID=UPI003420F9B7